jgi:MFS family permease
MRVAGRMTDTEQPPKPTQDPPAETVGARGPHDPLAALRYRDFRLLASGKLIGIVGEQMVSIALGWELYERTGSALALGMVGLAQVVPIMLFALPAGQVADRFHRKAVVQFAQVVLAFAMLALTALSYVQGPLWLIYTCLFFVGTARAYKDPAAASLVPAIVPAQIFTNAATWSSGSWQLASVLGPALGGLAVWFFGRATPVYAIAVGTSLTYLTLISAMRLRREPRAREAISRRSLMAGVRFVWQTKVILASITLDLFAVLLGGATALLPMFAKDILHVGPAGLGWLRSAPPMGAIVVAALIVYLPPFARAGKALLLAVAGFGLATIVFGLSTSFVLSLLMLATLGGLDQISVVIRNTLVLVKTPDALRGRVSAVHNMFLGASNELGEFESGVAAALVGPVAAVVAGGIGTLLVVALIALAWPEVRQLASLADEATALESA